VFEAVSIDPMGQKVVFMTHPRGAFIGRMRSEEKRDP
jgi:hypothetical protein